ncbi:hypothetical protein L6R50_18200 [Myxococcota bacterium]|nr:hypothetical protein [Myxococcota bacterium]
MRATLAAMKSSRGHVRSSRLCTYYLTILVRRAEEDCRVWVAHCLDFNVFGEGSTPGEASADLDEPVDMVVLDDLAAGLDPEERHAPEDDWADVVRLEATGRPVDVNGLPSDPADVSVVLVRRLRSYVLDELTGRWCAPPHQDTRGRQPPSIVADDARRVA